MSVMVIVRELLSDHLLTNFALYGLGLGEGIEPSPARNKRAARPSSYPSVMWNGE